MTKFVFLQCTCATHQRFTKSLEIRKYDVLDNYEARHFEFGEWCEDMMYVFELLLQGMTIIADKLYSCEIVRTT